MGENIENRGGHNKIFTINKEKELYRHIKTNFIDKHAPLTNNIIKELALNKFIENNDKNLIFNASDGWCTLFKKRWNLSTLWEHNALQAKHYVPIGCRKIEGVNFNSHLLFWGTQKIKCSKIATNLPTESEIDIFLDKFENAVRGIKKNSYLIMMKQVTM